MNPVPVSPNQRGRAERAFTSKELLLVLVIIGMLAALILPTLSHPELEGPQYRPRNPSRDRCES